MRKLLTTSLFIYLIFCKCLYADVTIKGNFKSFGDTYITGKGNIYITEKYIKGVKPEEYLRLAKEFDVTEAAVKNFLKILKCKQVPPDELDSTFRQIATRHKELQSRLKKFNLLVDPKVKKLRLKAEEAINEGDYESADTFLDDALDRQMVCIKNAEKQLTNCMLSAAEMKVEKGDLELIRINFKAATKLYKEAVKLVPYGHELKKSEYLKKWGDAAYSAGLYSDANKALVKCLKIRQKILPENNDKLLSTFKSLGDLDKAQGNYNNAEKLYTKILKILENKDIKGHPNIITTIISLSDIYYITANYTKAHSLNKVLLDNITAFFKKYGDVAYKPEEKIFFDDFLNFIKCDLKTIINDVNIEESNFNKNKYIKKKFYEKFQKIIITFEENILNNDNLLISTTTMKTKAQLYESQRNYIESERLIKKALDIKKKLLGNDHPDVAELLNYLALIYKKNNKLIESELLYKKALRIRMKKLGKEHPDVAITIYNLANLYYSQKRNEKAIQLFTKSLKLTENTLGNDHPRVACILNNLACSNEKNIDRERLFRKALTILEKYFDDEKPFVLKILDNIASLCEEKKEYYEAEKIYLRILKVKEMNLGEYHQEVIHLLIKIAELYENQDKFIKSEFIYKKILQNKDKFNSFIVLKILNKLSGIYISQKMFNKAEAVLMKIKIQEEKLGIKHSLFFWKNIYYRLFKLYKSKEKYDLAESYLIKQLELSKNIHSSGDVDDILIELAELYELKGRYLKAEQLYITILKKFEKYYSKELYTMINNHEARSILNKLAFVLKKQNKCKESELIYKRIIEYEKSYFAKTYFQSFNNLAMLYIFCGEYSKAKLIYKDILDTLLPQVSRLANLYNEVIMIQDLNNSKEDLYDLNHKKEVKKIMYRIRLEELKQCITIKHNLLNEDLDLSNKIKGIINNFKELAMSYVSQKEYSKAESLYIESLKISEQAFGKNHIITENINNNKNKCTIKKKNNKNNNKLVYNSDDNSRLEYKSTSNIKTNKIVKKNRYILRRQPKMISKEEISQIADEADHYFGVGKYGDDEDIDVWKPKEYIDNNFEDNLDDTITDHSTNLMWQETGSEKPLKFNELDDYIVQINNHKFAGYSDWRVPTLEEVMSLAEGSISDFFNSKQKTCWTSDKRTKSSVWYIDFSIGIIEYSDPDSRHFLRLVRTCPRGKNG